MNVPFLDFVGPYAELRPDLDAAYERFMRSAWYVLGKELEAFEQEYAAYCGGKHCVGVGQRTRRAAFAPARLRHWRR